jgi:hypothetical protein
MNGLRCSVEKLRRAGQSDLTGCGSAERKEETIEHAKMPEEDGATRAVVLAEMESGGGDA